MQQLQGRGKDQGPKTEKEMNMMNGKDWMELIFILALYAATPVAMAIAIARSRRLATKKESQQSQGKETGCICHPETHETGTRRQYDTSGGADEAARREQCGDVKIHARQIESALDKLAQNDIAQSQRGESDRHGYGDYDLGVQFDGFEIRIKSPAVEERQGIHDRNGQQQLFVILFQR